jgi:hypothetical protein
MDKNDPKVKAAITLPVKAVQVRVHTTTLKNKHSYDTLNKEK